MLPFGSTMRQLLMLVVCVCVSVGPAVGAVNATVRNAGSGKPKQKTTPVALPVITPVDAKLMKENEVATVQCPGAQVVAWYQVRTHRMLTNELTDEKGNPGKFVIADNTLNITRVGRADVGVYLCYDGLTRANYTVQVFMKPYVKELGRSINMAEGEPLILECDTFGWPPPKVTWIRSNPLNNFVQPLTPNVTAADPRIVANGTLLTILPVTREDYMAYMCIATNDLGSTNSTIVVRVKGKFTALWPFIGVVIEVVILIVVIIFFEKKKAKEIAQKQAAHAEEEKLLKSQQGKGKDDVRQRK